ncbi:MAG: tRNA (adenosine(37)-N6)-threonylcarbamoyltransferase complex ATPase subunit type 1 TsaE [Syntrophomonadaceae bacterium]|nr:tRNA (adenosine(37)-N6)-threonylcarbamoyltransferase complex ATPase subunit type 1 TsaE [Syntrophomonadaceae bacterium]
MDLIINSEEEMLALGKHMASLLEADDVVYLMGELGVGKTTLVRGIARARGYNGRVTSPTFTLMNIYEVDPPLYHFDFYRLETGDTFDLGLEDYLERKGISLIEWPNLTDQSLPAEALLVTISLLYDDYELARCVQITARGAKYEKKLEGLMQFVHSGHR